MENVIFTIYQYILGIYKHVHVTIDLNTLCDVVINQVQQAELHRTKMIPEKLSKVFLAYTLHFSVDKAKEAGKRKRRKQKDRGNKQGKQLRTEGRRKWKKWETWAKEIRSEVRREGREEGYT